MTRQLTDRADDGRRAGEDVAPQRDRTPAGRQRERDAAPLKLRAATSVEAAARASQARGQATRTSTTAASTALEPTDPRWVLAVRTAEQLDGAILRPERRERLIQMGKMFGLTTFDANLVIAIVQDQARRGYEPTYCPTAGASQLAMIPAPSAGRRAAGKLLKHKMTPIIATVMFIVAIEIVLVSWFFS